MTTMLEPILGTLDTRIVMVFVGIMAICIVLSLIKKAFKVAIIVAILAILVSMLVPLANEFQEKYKFSLEDGIVSITLDGQEYTIDRLECESIYLENKGMDGYALVIQMEEGVFQVTIPRFMLESMQNFAERYNIPLDVKE